VTLLSKASAAAAGKPVTCSACGILHECTPFPVSARALLMLCPTCTRALQHGPEGDLERSTIIDFAVVWNSLSTPRRLALLRLLSYHGNRGRR
jgi:hypothetical protein